MERPSIDNIPPEIMQYISDLEERNKVLEAIVKAIKTNSTIKRDSCLLESYRGSARYDKFKIKGDICNE